MPTRTAPTGRSRPTRTSTRPPLLPPGATPVPRDPEPPGPRDPGPPSPRGIRAFAFPGAGAPTERALVQVAGQALRMPADSFRAAAAAVDGPLYAALRRYTRTMLTQLARNAACNRVHSVRQRAARWLLMTADHMADLSFDLTQEFLAQMLAVRRASVSDVAQSLADDGCITYTRGTVTILDRDRLQDHACNCYAVITRAAHRAAR